MTMKLDQYRRGAMLLLAAFAALLSGCTTYVTTQVTAFSDWGNGSDATRTYAFARSPSQENSLEQTTYENTVANELAMYSFKQAPATEARYWVGLTYAIKSDMATVSQPVYYAPPPAFGPYWGPNPWGPWGPWGPYPTGYVTQSFPIYTHTLGIRITERATGKEVYNVTARNANDDPSLVTSMPYLVRSALDGFPAGNGAVRTVKIAVDKNGGASNEVAAPARVPPAGASSASPAAAPKPAQ
jgi:hypothetical protein